MRKALALRGQALALIGLAQDGGDPVTEGTDDSEVKVRYIALRAFVGFITVVVWTGFTCLIAQFYLQNKIHPDVNADPSSTEALNSFKYHPFDCFSRPDISLWVCFCPAIRWADNISTMGILRSFWLAFAVSLGFVMVTSETQDLVAWIVLSVIGAGFRRELRLKFQMQRNEMSFIMDFLLYCFCGCCAITQEARQVEEAMRSGHPNVVKAGEDAA